MIPWHTLISMMNPSPQFDTDGNLIRSSDPDRIRLELLSSLSQHTGRNVLTYYSGHLFSNQYNVAMDQYDTPGIINAVDNLDPSVGLDLILHTPGGSVTFAEGLVKYLHQVFQDIRVIIPQEAFSAGTIVALASKEILMGPMACIGPIMQTMPIDRLKPAKYNPRKDLKPGDPAYEKIKRSLHDFGYVDPIVWNEVTGNIVGGHQRFKVLKAEGATEVDCVVVHIENPSDEKALNIALNKATGDWEPTALADLLQDLQSAGYDLGATGFDAAEVDDLFSKVHDKDVHDDDCDIDPETVNAYVQPGDIWTLGRHRMMCGDSTSPEAVDALMDGIKANLVVTDPPYNVAYESADGKKIQNDSMADEQFFSFLLAAFQNMAAHMAEGGSAYIFHADTEGLNFRRAFKESGFHISGVCIWVKNSLVLGRSPYQWQHEPVLYGWLPNGKHKWFADRKQSTIWNFDKPKKSADHPTMKPIPLLAYPIKNSSAPNAVVMDLFGGSGSTLIACEQTDRICRTMELDPKYATVIVERFHQEYPDQEITVLRDGQTVSYDSIVIGS